MTETIQLGKPIDILMVEDNPGDARLTIEALKDSRINNELYHAKDGAEGMAFLRKEGEYADAPRPDIILLDINLPKKNGHEVLKEIKENKDLRTIPVVMLTTSEAEQDIIKAYEQHANCYISKPVDLSKFIQIARHIEDFWLTIVKLPSRKTG